MVGTPRDLERRTSLTRSQQDYLKALYQLHGDQRQVPTGDLAHRLTHPSYEISKEYVVMVGGSPNSADLVKLREGVKLDDGMTAPAEVEVLRVLPGPMAELRIVIREGRHRQVRRMLLAVGHRVQSLRRVAFGPLKLGRLKVG